MVGAIPLQSQGRPVAVQPKPLCLLQLAPMRPLLPPENPALITVDPTDHHHCLPRRTPALAIHPGDAQEGVFPNARLRRPFTLRRRLGDPLELPPITLWPSSVRSAAAISASPASSDPAR